MFKLLKVFNRKDILFIIFCIIFIIFQVWLDLKIPDYMSKITSLVQTSGTKIGDILEQGTYMILCAAGSLLASFIVGYLVSFLAATFSKRTRKLLFEKVS